MNKLHKVIINHSGCKKYLVQLLNGNTILITHDDPYITSDVKELQHLGSQTFLKILDAEDKDYKNLLLDSRFLPEVKRILNINDAKEFLWKDDQEDMVIKKLKEHGYFISTKESESKKSIDLSDEALIKMLRSRGYIGFKKNKSPNTIVKASINEDEF